MNNTVISVHNLVKKFGSFVANDNLNFEVFAGEIFGFLGANGAGKTTAIRILSGLSKPTSGEVTVAGFDAYRQSELIKKNIGYMCQKFSLYEDLTVKENIIQNASLIRTYTQDGIMPPPESGRTISQQQKNDIYCWVQNGAQDN